MVQTLQCSAFAHFDLEGIMAKAQCILARDILVCCLFLLQILVNYEDFNSIMHWPVIKVGEGLDPALLC